MDDALGEPDEEHLVLDRASRRVGLLILALRVMQEDEVEIGGVAELPSTELSVPGGADAHGPPSAIGAAGVGSRLTAVIAHRNAELAR